MYPVKRLLAVVEELVQFPGGRQHLCAGVDQLEQVGPHLINHVLPLCNSCSVCVFGRDQLVTDLIDCCDALLTNVLCVTRKLLEAVSQHLAERDIQKLGF